MIDTQEALADIVQRSLDAAGIPDADPQMLPERIEELAFLGTFTVPEHEYPRRGPTKSSGEEKNQGGGGVARIDRQLRRMANS